MDLEVLRIAKRRNKKMTFELWLFAIKRLAQTQDATITIFNQLCQSEKDRLEEEYNSQFGKKI